MTTEELDWIRDKVSGLHFSKEALSNSELDIFYLAEALLAEVDALCCHLQRNEDRATFTEDELDELRVAHRALIGRMRAYGYK